MREGKKNDKIAKWATHLLRQRSSEVADVWKKNVNDLVEFSNHCWRAAIKILLARSENIRGWASSPVSNHEHPVTLISNPIRACLLMQIQHYLQYQSNLLPVCGEEGHTSRKNTFRTSLVRGVGLQVGGLCVVCVLVGGEVTPRAESCTLMTLTSIYFTLEDFAVIKLCPSYFRLLSVLQLM